MLRPILRTRLGGKEMFICYGIYFRLRTENMPSDSGCMNEHKFYMKAEEKNSQAVADADRNATIILRTLVTAFADKIDGEVRFTSNRSHTQRIKISFKPADLDRVIELAGLIKGEVSV